MLYDPSAIERLLAVAERYKNGPKTREAKDRLITGLFQACDNQAILAAFNSMFRVAAHLDMERALRSAIVARRAKGRFDAFWRSLRVLRKYVGDNDFSGNVHLNGHRIEVSYWDGEFMLTSCDNGEAGAGLAFLSSAGWSRRNGYLDLARRKIEEARQFEGPVLP